MPHNSTYQLYQLGLKVNEHAVRLTQIEQRLGNIEHALSDRTGRSVTSAGGSSPGGYEVVGRVPESGAEHRVAKGENLTVIARRYGVSVPSIVRANALQSPDRLAIGQRLVIPAVAAGGDDGPAPAEPTAYGDTDQEAPSDASASSLAGKHVVRKNETLFSIAQRHGVPVRELQAYNGIPNPAEIWPGQEIRIPRGSRSAGEPDLPDVDWKSPERPSSAGSPTSGTAVESTALTHRVRSGETLGTIARRYGVPTRTLQSMNAINDPNRLAVGQVLLIPTAAPDDREATIASATLEPATDAPDPGDDALRIEASPVETVEMGASNVSAGREFFGYFVVSGDTVEKVATVFGTTPETLRRINDLPPDGELTPGEQILIPAEAVYGS